MFFPIFHSYFYKLRYWAHGPCVRVKAETWRESYIQLRRRVCIIIPNYEEREKSSRPLSSSPGWIGLIHHQSANSALIPLGAMGPLSRWMIAYQPIDFSMQHVVSITELAYVVVNVQSILDLDRHEYVGFRDPLNQDIPIILHTYIHNHIQRSIYIYILRIYA